MKFEITQPQQANTSITPHLPQPWTERCMVRPVLMWGWWGKASQDLESRCD